MNEYNDENEQNPGGEEIPQHEVNPPQSEWRPPSYEEIIRNTQLSEEEKEREEPASQFQFNFSDYNKFSETTKNSVPSHEKRNKGLNVFLAIMCGLLVVAVLTFAGYGVYSMLGRGTMPQTSGSGSQGNKGSTSGYVSITDKPSGSDGSQAEGTDGPMSAVEVAKRVRPSVVGVVVYSDLIKMTPTSEGSGIILSKDGYIVTNAHVISGNVALVRVILNNNEEYEGQIIGSDTKTDLAVIKIEADNLNFATFGNSEQTEVGETVLAIGNPLGMQLAGSVTQGIVSAVDRVLSSTNYNMTAIQTDAAINPGNSGGALVNMYGQVIGINSSKIAEVDYEGIGFAIPINQAKPIIDDLMTYGYVKDRVRLGFTSEVITEVTANKYGVPVGLLIVSIDEESDLLSKGVSVGDVVTHINGKEITGSSVLINELANHKPGDVVKLSIFRRSQSGPSRSFDVNVKLIEDKGQTK